jgi:hypothetical protein
MVFSAETLYYVLLNLCFSDSLGIDFFLSLSYDMDDIHRYETDTAYHEYF